MNYSHITPEAIMAMKSPPGDDSPLRQGAGGDLLNPPRWDWRRGVSGRFSVSWLSVLGFSRRRLFVGGRVGQGATRGPHTLGRRGQGLGRAALWCRRLVAPLPSLFGLLEAPCKNRTLGEDFVQFREYFLTRISETKNSRKQQLALRHLVNRLVPENA